MFIFYPILLVRSNKQEIIKAWSPDLNKEFDFHDAKNVANNFELIPFLQVQIQDYVNNTIKKNNNIKPPKKIKDFTHITIGENDIWIKICIKIPNDIYKENRFFSRALPKIGVAISLIASLCFGVITLLSFELLAGDKKEAGKISGLISALFLIIINTVIYLYSNARQDLSYLGSKIDNYFFKKKNVSKVNFTQSVENLTTSNNDLLVYQEDQLLISNASAIDLPKITLNSKGTTALILSKLALYGSALAVTVIDAITNSQEVKTLAERAIENGSIVPGEFIFTLAITQAITNGISELAVFTSFMNLALKDIEKHLGKKYGVNQEVSYEIVNSRDEGADSPHDENFSIKQSNSYQWKLNN